MISRVKAVAILTLLMILGIGVSAQNPKPTPQHANPKFGEGDFLINSLTFESFAGKIGVATPPGVVKSLNGKTGDLILQGSSNITVTTSGNTLTVSAPTALSGVEHDATLTGTGTTLSPLSVVSAESQQEPFYAGKTEGFLNTGITLDLATVPAGKRLVIEHLSGNCLVAMGDRVSELELNVVPAGGGSLQRHQVNPSFTSGNPIDRYVWSQSVRFIFDSGAQVRLHAGKNINQAFGFCEAFLAGYLVDKP
jgi:hypothetical protein